MKIGMILDNEFSGDLRVENEAVALSKAGHEVFVLCLNFGEKKNYEEFHGVKILRIPISRKLKKKLAGLNNTIFNFYPRFWARHIKRFVRENKIDVLHVHDLWMLEGAFRANKKLGLPLIADLHENFVHALGHYRYANTFPGKFLISQKRWAKKEKEWCLQADWIITVIDEAVERYIALGVPPEKITVVPNYVNLEEFLPEKFDESILSKFKEDFKLVYTGGFDTHRGLETLLEAAAILKSRIENLKVLLVGSGSNYDSLQELSQKLELDKVVSFEGWQPVEKLPSYIAASDIGIIPHLKTVHTDNTIPHKLFQYMFLEKPVIATDCAPLVRIIKESNAGLIYPSGNAQALAERIYELYTKPSLREEMGLNGKNAVLQKYNWEKAAGNLIRLYEKIS